MFILPTIPGEGRSPEQQFYDPRRGSVSKTIFLSQVSRSLFAQLGLDGLDAQELPSQLLENITLAKIVQAVLAVGIAYGLLVGIDRSHNWVVAHVPSRFRQLFRQSVPLAKAMILFFTVIFVVDLFVRLSPNNILALTGTLAVALGFAFKDYVSSIIAGIVALFETPYRMGDRVKIGDHYGEVINYGLRGIQLRTLEDNVVTIPHNSIWSEPISNANNGALEAQVIANFYFGHDVDVDLIMQILYRAAYTSKYTQLKLPVMVRLDEKPWGTHFKLKCYPIDIQDETAYKTDLIRRAKQSFSSHQVPYPTFSLRDIHDPEMGGPEI
ncbi:MAG: mechanosensitive ion channel family protein [Synechococcaceae cyanobacterium SM2_3_1]|nr:mechanosensitive ion channel family protein [Synechococcaceae cyanobacterium SM2_3_1]